MERIQKSKFSDEKFRKQKFETILVNLQKENQN
jgi:hypothetical protein